MKDLKIYIVLLLGIVFCVGIYLWGVYGSPEIPSDIDVLNSKIDSLEHKIDSLNIKRDSIRLIVDTSKVKIIEIHEKYNKIHTNIVYQPVDSDYVQFAKYCSDNRGLLNISDSSAIEDN